MEHIIFTAAEVAVILLLIVVLIKRKKRKRKKEELQQVNQEKERNSLLEEQLRNPELGHVVSKNMNPYEVQYNEVGKGSVGQTPKQQLELEVHTDTSVKRYLFDLGQEISIGSAEQNMLSVSDSKIADTNVVIFVKNHHLYARNPQGEIPFVLRRGKNQVMIRQQSVQIQPRDLLILGDTEIRIMMYNNG